MPVHRVDQWDVQAVIKRLNESLIARGYLTWFDLTNMKGVLRLPRSPTHPSSTPPLRSDHALVTRVAHRKHDGCDERCDRGSRCDVVWREPAIQGVGKCECVAGGVVSSLNRASLTVHVATMTVSYGSKLCSSARVGHDTTNGAKRLLAKRLA